MTAWATVVAERLGFKRTEALSLGELPHAIIVQCRSLTVKSLVIG